MRLLFAFALAVLASFLFAGEPITVVSPQAGQVQDGGVVDLGAIGPGQTFIFEIDPRVSAGGTHGIGGVYDQIAIAQAPQGWQFKNSDGYSVPMQAQITAAKDAPDGEYEVTATVVDEGNGEGLGVTVLRLRVVVKKDVIGMTVYPKSQEVGAGQPARYTITLSNTGSANDLFIVSSSGVRGWNFRKSVYVPAGSSKQITYEVVGDEEERYGVTLSAVSQSSDRISRSEGAELVVKASLSSDLKAVTRGLLIFPLIEGPAYYLFGLASNLF